MDCIDKVTKHLRLVFGDVTLGVHGAFQGKKFDYIFSYVTGGPESFVINGMEWLYRTARPTFWRVFDDNKRGEQNYFRKGIEC